jgi:hypothetical protein
MTKNKQQTAVEWLVEQFKEYDFADVKDEENYIIKMQSFVLTEKLEQAKAMHKTEHFNTWWHSISENEPITFDQYYNETYGGEQ